METGFVIPAKPMFYAPKMYYPIDLGFLLYEVMTYTCRQISGTSEREQLSLGQYFCLLPSHNYFFLIPLRQIYLVVC